MIGKTNAISGVSAPVPKIKTVSGSVISIADALAQSAVSLVADINAVQSGSGDPSPSNVRPISGWSAVKVTRTGKNLIDDSKTYVSGSTTVYVGAESSGYTVALSAGTYTISVDFSGETYGMFYREANDSANTSLWNSGSGTTEKTFTIEEDGTFRFWVYRNAASGGVDPTKIIHVQIELGSTATAYEPYNGNAYNIQLGQTVYGGTLDVTTGVLTVDMGVVNLASLEYTTVTSGGVTVFRNNIGAKSVSDNMQHGFTSIYPFAGTRFIGNMPDKTWMIDSNGRLSIRDDSYNDPSVFANSLTGQSCVYYLATPQTVQLTPTEVQMLLGNNTIWSDSGDTELQYWARR